MLVRNDDRISKKLYDAPGVCYFFCEQEASAEDETTSEPEQVTILPCNSLSGI
jgi:hypothetical protein